jgi:hypothetical protein
MIPQIAGEINAQFASFYLTCAAEFEDTYLNEMGQQGWEMVILSKLKATSPGGEWCRGVTVGYGLEVVWKRVK